MSIDKPKRNKPRCRPLKLTNDHRKKAIAIMAIMDRQVQEAESLKHFVHLMQNLAITMQVSMPTLATIYKKNFVDLNRGYFDVHPERIDESIGPEDLGIFA